MAKTAQPDSSESTGTPAFAGDDPDSVGRIRTFHKSEAFEFSACQRMPVYLSRRAQAGAPGLDCPGLDIASNTGEKRRASRLRTPGQFQTFR